MSILIRAVVTGFGMALGAALYHKLARQIGFEEPEEEKEGKEEEPTPDQPAASAA